MPNLYYDESKKLVMKQIGSDFFVCEYCVGLMENCSHASDH